MMICSYFRQTTQYSPFEYLENPDQFDEVPPSMTCYKNMVFLTDADEEEKNFHVYSIGYEVSDPTKRLLDRLFPAHAIIHYIVDGKGTFDGKPIGRGDCAIAFRNRVHSLCSDPDDPFKFYWIMIKHPETFSLDVFGLDESHKVFTYDFEDQMKRIFEELLHFRTGTQDPYCFYLGKFYELMSYHKKPLPVSQDASRHQNYNNYVTLARRMWEQSSYGLSVEDVAHSLGFSRKHFSLLFEEQTGVLPQQYIVEHKIRLAKLRIEAGETSLKNLAFQLGYGDYPSFSRAFKRKTGISPRDFLAEVRKNNSEILDPIIYSIKK